MMRTTPMSWLTCATFSVTSSETRSPLAYSVSSIVRSRRPSGVLDVGRGEQFFDVLLGQRLGQAARQLGRVDVERGIDLDLALAQRVLVKALEARQQPARARGLGFAGDAVREIREQIAVIGGEQRLLVPLVQPACELREIEAIAVERVAREPVLEPQRIAEFVERRRHPAFSCRSSHCLI